MIEVNKIACRFLKTATTSDEVFAKALQTVPFLPHRAHITFLARCVEIPQYPDSYEEEQYLRECEDKGLIPFSRVRLIYSPTSRSFYPDRLPMFYFSEANADLPRSRAEHMVESLLEGRKPNQIDVDIGGRYQYSLGKEAYDAFINSQLHLLQEKGYQPQLGNLYIETHPPRHHGNNEDYDVWLVFGKGKRLSEGREFLDRDRTISEGIMVWWRKMPHEYQQLLASWFENLTQLPKRCF